MKILRKFKIYSLGGFPPWLKKILKVLVWSLAILVSISVITCGTLLLGFADKDQIYHLNGAVRYEGETKGGRPHGQGKLFNTRGDVVAKGSFAGGKLDGFASLYSGSRLRYKGMWSEGRPHGFGDVFYSNGSVKYTGRWLNGQKFGKGSLYDRYENLLLEGKFFGNIIYGAARCTAITERWPGYDSKVESAVFKRSWQQNIYSGHVKFYKGDTLIYNGLWKHGLPHGSATIYNISGDKLFEGTFLDGNIVKGSFYNSANEQYSPSLNKALIKTANGKAKPDNWYSPAPNKAKNVLTDILNVTGYASEMKELENVIEPASHDKEFKSLMYQFIEINEADYDKELATKIIQEFERIPINILRQLVQKGARHRFIHGDISDQPEVTRNRIVNPAGLASYSNNLMITRIDTFYPKKTALHEVGHFVDYFLVPGSTKVFEAEAANLFTDPYFRDDRSEFFADSFAGFFISSRLRSPRSLDRARIKAEAPKTYTFFKKEVKRYNPHKKSYTSYDFYREAIAEGVENPPSPEDIRTISVEANTFKQRLKGGFYNFTALFN
ncbi:hypothetical protein PRVXH_001735 [Proteinivorax hydrogeniformans]|uniref:Anthrax toxin lethal/endema factor N-/C-terminal domain-containing protein n=1 Tax=Proteinivorax hydrogeniformans TaxID=1826727 RepID=A0AAU8HQT7_9FIRM